MHLLFSCWSFFLRWARGQREPAPASGGRGVAAPATGADGPARRIEADVRYLADDKLEGREAGTRGYDLAADYVAKRYAELGLQPAGDGGGFFQQVPMLKAVREETGAALVVNRNGRSIALRFRDQFLPALNYNAASHALEAPAVFVGLGVHAPELNHDDFKASICTARSRYCSTARPEVR